MAKRVRAIDLVLKVLSVLLTRQLYSFQAKVIQYVARSANASLRLAVYGDPYQAERQAIC
jgi:hypothetical protein